jgi:hypothetical protein
MKKILLGFLLIIALVVISYYSAVRTDNRVKKEYTSGYSKGEKEALVQKSRADSLESSLRQTRNQFNDSLKIIALAQEAVVDSLSRAIESKDKALAERTSRKSQNSKKSDSGTRKANLSRPGITHAQILDFYKGKLKTLPADLSPYERTVALDEIREETSKKFSISVTDLDSIRKVNNLAE